MQLITKKNSHSPWEEVGFGDLLPISSNGDGVRGSWTVFVAHLHKLIGFFCGSRKKLSGRVLPVGGSVRLLTGGVEAPNTVGRTQTVLKILRKK